MAIKDGLRTLFLAQSSITSLCPPQTIDDISEPGIFLNVVKQKFKPPHIVIRREGKNPNLTMDGYKRSNIEVECVAGTASDAAAIAKAVSDFFDPYKGAAGASDYVDMVIWDDAVDSEEPENSGLDQWRHKMTLKFQVTHHAI